MLLYCQDAHIFFSPDSLLYLIPSDHLYFQYLIFVHA